MQCTGTFSVVLVALGIMCGELLLQSSLNIVQEESTINSNQSIWRPTVAPELRARCFVSLAQKLFATKSYTINIISPYDCRWHLRTVAVYPNVLDPSFLCSGEINIMPQYKGGRQLCIPCYHQTLSQFGWRTSVRRDLVLFVENSDKQAATCSRPHSAGADGLEVCVSRCVRM